MSIVTDEFRCKCSNWIYTKTVHHENSLNKTGTLYLLCEICNDIFDISIENPTEASVSGAAWSDDRNDLLDW